jgi:voltage-gated potassium channel
MAAALMHLAEHQAQPERFGSIPDAMWWAIITLTTVGYGDVVPITPFGKLVAAITALCGLVMLALPVGIIATSFSEVIRRREFVVSWSMVARVPMFADLDARAMSELLGNIRSQLFEAGETILRKDDPPEAMFVIAEGAVEAIKGQRTLVLSVGDVFGELGVLIHRRRSMTVRARTRTRVLIIDADDLHGLFERHPGLREHLTAVTTARYGAETNASRNEDRA